LEDGENSTIKFSCFILPQSSLLRFPSHVISIPLFTVFQPFDAV